MTVLPMVSSKMNGQKSSVAAERETPGVWDCDQKPSLSKIGLSRGYETSSYHSSETLTICEAMVVCTWSFLSSDSPSETTMLSLKPLFQTSVKINRLNQDQGLRESWSV